MAVKKPVVETDGELELLQPTDTLDTGADTFNRTFTATAIPGQVLYADSNTSVNLAQANSDTTSKIVGIAPAAVTASNPGAVSHDGLVQLSTIQWDAVTSQSGGLTLGTKYYLSDMTPGMMLPSGNLAGISQGEYVMQVGTAISDVEMLVQKVRRVRR